MFGLPALAAARTSAGWKQIAKAATRRKSDKSFRTGPLGLHKGGVLRFRLAVCCSRDVFFMLTQHHEYGTNQVRLRGRFKPFVLHLSDGRKFKIPHPEFILVGKGVVVVLRKDGLVETLNALHITSVEDSKAKAA